MIISIKVEFLELSALGVYTFVVLGYIYLF